MMLKRIFSFVLSSFLIAFNSLPVLAQTAPPPAVPINYDLSSTDRNSTSPVAQRQPVVIMTGGRPRSVDANKLLTPAERMAVFQVFSTGQQTLNLDSAGSAVGGRFLLSPNFQNWATGLVIPASVTGLKNVAQNATLNLTGDLVNKGNLFVFTV